MPRTRGAKTGKRGNSINKEQFEKLASMMCNVNEIASFFDVSFETLNQWCKDNYPESQTASKTIDRLNNKGRVNLRRIQMQLAEKNSAMAIFLGKQYLGQTDKVENNNIERVAIVNDLPEDDEEDI